MATAASAHPAPPPPDPLPPEPEATRWLTPDERATWLAMARFMVTLPRALDAQLERDAGLSYFEYIVMAMLSEQSDRTLRMSQLAAYTNASLSRLSHVAKRLEGAGLVRRQCDDADRRSVKAVLTDEGMDVVVAAAPQHVTTVRELVFDPLTGAQVHELRAALEAVLERIDPGGTWDRALSGR